MSIPTRFRKRPVEVTAIQVTETNVVDVAEWCGGMAFPGAGLVIPTLEGAMRADIGDWVIRGLADEHYPCKPAIFAATYEAL